VVRTTECDQADDLELPLRQGERRAGDGRAHGAPGYARHAGTGIGRWEYWMRLDPGGAKSAAHEARLVPARVRLVQLVLRERADAQKHVELVTQVCPHHLRAVRRDREADAVLDERA